jgi:inner membrane protein
MADAVDKVAQIREQLAKPGARAFLVAAIGLVMLVPLLLVQGLVGERTMRHASVTWEIARFWGNDQKITGPVLIAPIEKRAPEAAESDFGQAWIKVTKPDKGPRRHVVVLPEVLDIEASLPHEVRHRSIFNAVVYRATMSARADFVLPDLATLAGADANPAEAIAWDRARLVLGISDTAAIRAIGAARFGDAKLAFEPGTGLTKLMGPGIHAAAVGIDPDAANQAFSTVVELNGSGTFFVTPVGKTTRFRLTSDWPHPSFEGAFLPDEREISDDGFAAAWEIPHLARSFPQAWIHQPGSNGNTVALASYAGGVRIYQPVDLYQLTARAAKYGVLFVALTLLTFFILESVTGRRLHVVQYGVIAGGLVLFFLLLLSLAEHIGFAAAYLVAAGAEIAVIVAYAAAALADRRQAAIAAAVLTALYLALFFILKAEDYALLAGTLLLFGALAATMYATRNLRHQAAAQSDA